MTLEQQLLIAYQIGVEMSDADFLNFAVWGIDSARTDYAWSIHSSDNPLQQRELKMGRQIWQLIKDNLTYVATSDHPYFKEWVRLIKKESSND
jgi:hypothetical protein